MSSDFDTYGRLHAKSAFLSEEGVRIHLDTDDTKTITLKATPSQAGNVDITLPTSAGALLNASSNLNGANLTTGSVATAALADDAVTADKVDISSAADIGAGLADADSFLVSDSDAANAVKRVTGSALKTYVGAVPSGTDGQILVNNSGTYASVALSGDATINNAGALTLQAGAVADAEVAAGAAIAGSKIAPDFGAQKIETTGDAEVGSASAFYIGDSGTDGSWRMRVNGTKIVWEKRETGFWNEKGSFDSA